MGTRNSELAQGYFSFIVFSQKHHLHFYWITYREVQYYFQFPVQFAQKYLILQSINVVLQ